jgi:para-aminobenzoate synthetase/4-amino-4-deoxychorismate lyase
VELREGNISMGVGGGITADSKPDEEYEECCLKASFLTSKRPAFALIETMRCEGGIALLADHMERLAGSAKYFGIRYDAEELLHKLSDVVTSCGGTVSRVRVELNERGESLITAEPLESLPWQGRLLLAEERVDASEVFLRHKTTNRGLYERTLAEARQLGFDEVVFLNEKGCVTEGAISNLFLQAGTVWSTPSLDSGVLPGVQRSHLLAALHGAQSCEVSLEDLESADCVNVCSALRGVRPVRSIARRDGSLVWCLPSESSRS